ncbi:1980_t:CDS:2, partial [Ambispora leptoticha]
DDYLLKLNDLLIKIIDYVIKSLEELLCITEGKPCNIKITQLESAFQTNKKKRTADQAFGNDYFDYIYGIVTTGTECTLSYILRMVFTVQVVVNTRLILRNPSSSSSSEE